MRDYPKEKGINTSRKMSKFMRKASNSLGKTSDCFSDLNTPTSEMLMNSNRSPFDLTFKLNTK